MDLHTGTPLWPIRDGLLGTYPSLKQDVTAEVAVIGAGITGALVAYELSRAGANVVVLDRRDVASGSSAATTGLLLYDTDASLVELTRSVGESEAVRAYRLGLEAIDRIEQLTRELGDRCGFSRRPSVYLASTRRAVRSLEKEYRLRRANGFEVEFLDRRDLERTYSFTAPAAIRAQGTGEVDCYRLTHRLLEAAHRAGVRIFDRTAVKRWRQVAGGMTIETAGGQMVKASRVVAATGYEVAEILQRPTGRLATTWVFASEPLEAFDGWQDRCLIWETARPYIYIRSTDDGRLVAGGEDEPGPERHLSVRRQHRKMDRLVRRVRTMFPKLEIDVAYQWAGTFATTDDGLPFIGAVPEHPGVWFALGYGGNGITFGVLASALIRDAYLGVPNEAAPLFSFDRTGRRDRADSSFHSASRRVGSVFHRSAH
jgi:glycine/D-amino acid oxidase-like deaminating enzyme